jgi:hypothetical protein
MRNLNLNSTFNGAATNGPLQCRSITLDRMGGGAVKAHSRHTSMPCAPVRRGAVASVATAGPLDDVGV